MRLFLAEQLASLNEMTLEKAFKTNGLDDMKVEVIRDINVRELDVVYTVDMTDDGTFNSREESQNVKVYVKKNAIGLTIADV